MSSKVGIVELAAHNEVVWAYAKIFLQIADTVSIFTNAFTYQQLYDLHDHPQIEWIIQSKDTDNAAFITNHLDDLNALDSVVFSTILPPDFEFFSTLRWSAKTYYVIHDANFFFFPKANFFLREGLVNTAKDYIKRLRFYIQNETDRNNRFLTSFTGLLVPAQSVYDYLQDKDTHPHTIHGVLNFAVNDNTPAPTHNYPIHIVVPGSISNKSRDYEPLIQALQILKEKAQASYTFTFLGRAMDGPGRATLTHLRALHSPALQIVTYDTFIPQQEFDEVMRSASFLILPVNQIMKISTIKEQNGYTCVSGNINDMIKYGKPALLPHYYPINSSMKDMVMQYTDAQDLASSLLSIDGQMENMAIQEPLLQNSAVVIAKRIEGLIL